jgi:hypothetical protein
MLAATMNRRQLDKAMGSMYISWLADINIYGFSTHLLYQWKYIRVYFPTQQISASFGLPS